MSIVYSILIAVLCMVLTVAVIMLCKASHPVDDDEVSFKKSREYKVCDSCGAHVYRSDNSTCSVCGNTVYFGEKVKTKEIDSFDHIPNVKNKKNVFDHIPSTANTKNVFDHIQSSSTRRRQTNHAKQSALANMQKQKEKDISAASYYVGYIILAVFLVILNLIFTLFF